MFSLYGFSMHGGGRVSVHDSTMTQFHQADDYCRRIWRPCCQQLLLYSHAARNITQDQDNVSSLLQKSPSCHIVHLFTTELYSI